MQEQGVVREVRGGVAEIAIRAASDEACAACGSCDEGPKGRTLVVDRVPGLEPGVRVVVEVREKGGLGPPLMAFLLPVAAIVVGAAVGGAVPGWLGQPGLSGTLFSVLGAGVLLAAALAAVRGYDRSLRRRGYGPRIVRIES